MLREIKADAGQRTLALSRDGRLLATAAQERVTLWDSSGPSCERSRTTSATW